MREQRNDWLDEPYEVQADTIIVSKAESVLDDLLIAQLAFGDIRVSGKVKAATARRIAACVNVLKGIPTESLEDGIIEKAMRAMVDLEKLQQEEPK